MASAFTGILKNQILSRNTHLETSLTQKKKNVPDSRKPPGRIQEYYHKVIQRAEYYLAQLSENESW